jgi:cytoplasmic iron level regulating protein YaaA (DUF328/UPF0246 family)
VLILLPPSEGKKPPRRGRRMDLAGLSFPSLRPDREATLDEQVTLCSSQEPAAAAAVLGLGRTQLDQVSVDAALREAPTARADQVYSGVLYEALDLPTLESAARRRATSWLAITSGLFGLLRPADRVPAYRLSGDVTLPGIGALSTWWSRRLDPAVREAAGRGLVVDLRSSTYAAFWRPGPDLARRVVGVRVLHEVDGTRRVVSHFNKATKGRLVRTLLESGLSPSSTRGLAADLAALGWTVERGPSNRYGEQLDVVVSEL